MRDGAFMPRIEKLRCWWLPALAGAWLALPVTADEMPVIHVFKESSCGCCRPWIKYMQSEGFRLEVTDVPSVQPIKLEKGIPPAHTSCHTATIDGYVLEGHVSAEEVRRLLTERPPIVGLLVPGMPKGAPGMEGPDAVAYDVLALTRNGEVSVYASHSAAPAPTATPAAEASESPPAPASPAALTPPSSANAPAP